MNGLCDRVAVITGAGRGIGREHALLFAREGASVVVNDLGGSTDGVGSSTTAAEAVAAEIRAAGGRAVANSDSVADWQGAQRLIQTAIDEFGRLDVLVNNAGILRDRMLVNMSELDWDAVMNVHLKGTFCPTRHAAAYWREQTKAGRRVEASVICTTSDAGLGNNVGQANYGTAKAAIATFTQIAAKELGRYGVRVNAIAPGAKTRLVGGLESLVASERPDKEIDDFDRLSPANVSPVVAYLAMRSCPLTGCVLQVFGAEIGLFQGWSLVDRISTDGRWTLAGIDAELRKLVSRFGSDTHLPSESFSFLDEMRRRFGEQLGK